MPADDHRTTISIPQELIALIEEIRVLSRANGTQVLPRGLRTNKAVIWLATEQARQVVESLRIGGTRSRTGRMRR